MSSEDITTYKLVMVMLWRFSERSISQKFRSALRVPTAAGVPYGLFECAEREALAVVVARSLRPPEVQ
jgi:hypothetical protein